MPGHTCYHCKQWVEEGEAQETGAQMEAAPAAIIEAADATTLQDDAAPQFEIAELTIDSDETVPLPIWRSSTRA